MVKLDIKVPKRRVYLETDKVERGKPREWETQIMVGEFLSAKWSMIGIINDR